MGKAAETAKEKAEMEKLPEKDRLKKEADVKEDVAHTTKLNKESTEELKKDEAEIAVKKEVKEAKRKAQKPKPEDLQKPWGTTSEVWTANMPEHHLEGYAQKDRKDFKENELVQNKNEEEESEDESSDEDEE